MKKVALFFCFANILTDNTKPQVMQTLFSKHFYIIIYLIYRGLVLTGHKCRNGVRDSGSTHITNTTGVLL